MFADEIEQRQHVAQRYNAALSNRFTTPYVPDGLVSTWAQYTLQLANRAERDAFLARAKEAGVPTAVYYPIPLHLQKAYDKYPRDPAGLPVSEDLAGRVVSLPMHPYLAADTQTRIIEAIVGEGS